jgi:hypothetical protein
MPFEQFTPRPTPPDPFDRRPSVRGNQPDEKKIDDIIAGRGPYGTRDDNRRMHSYEVRGTDRGIGLDQGRIDELDNRWATVKSKLIRMQQAVKGKDAAKYAEITQWINDLTATYGKYIEAVRASKMGDVLTQLGEKISLYEQKANSSEQEPASKFNLVSSPEVPTRFYHFKTRYDKANKEMYKVGEAADFSEWKIAVKPLHADEWVDVQPELLKRAPRRYVAPKPAPVVVQQPVVQPPVAPSLPERPTEPPEQKPEEAGPPDLVRPAVTPAPSLPVAPVTVPASPTATPPSSPSSVPTAPSTTPTAPSPSPSDTPPPTPPASPSPSDTPSANTESPLDLTEAEIEAVTDSAQASLLTNRRYDPTDGAAILKPATLTDDEKVRVESVVQLQRAGAVDRLRCIRAVAEIIGVQKAREAGIVFFDATKATHVWPAGIVEVKPAPETNAVPRDLSPAAPAKKKGGVLKALKDVLPSLPGTDGIREAAKKAGEKVRSTVNGLKEKAKAKVPPKPAEQPLDMKDAIPVGAAFVRELHTMARALPAPATIRIDSPGAGRIGTVLKELSDHRAAINKQNAFAAGNYDVWFEKEARQWTEHDKEFTIQLDASGKQYVLEIREKKPGGFARLPDQFGSAEDFLKPDTEEKYQAWLSALEAHCRQPKPLIDYGITGSIGTLLGYTEFLNRKSNPQAEAKRIILIAERLQQDIAAYPEADRKSAWGALDIVLQKSRKLAANPEEKKPAEPPKPKEVTLEKTPVRLEAGMTVHCGEGVSVERFSAWNNVKVSVDPNIWDIEKMTTYDHPWINGTQDLNAWKNNDPQPLDQFNFSPAAEVSVERRPGGTARVTEDGKERVHVSLSPAKDTMIITFDNDKRYEWKRKVEKK